MLIYGLPSAEERGYLSRINYAPVTSAGVVVAAARGRRKVRRSLQRGRSERERDKTRNNERKRCRERIEEEEEEERERRRGGGREGGGHGRAKRRAGANLACQEVAYSSRTKASRGTRARLEAALGTYRSVWMVEDDEKDG